MSKCINVKNLVLAEETISITNGVKTRTYGTPEVIPGVMKVEIVPNIASGKQMGDGILREKISKRSYYTVSIDINRIPNKWRKYIEGTSIVSGVQSDKGDCNPGHFAMGWESEHIESGNVSDELTWFVDCVADPIEDTLEQQGEKDINISNSTVKIDCFKVSEFEDRAYTKIDTADKDVTQDMVQNFFKKVQTTDTIAAPTSSTTSETSPQA